MVRFIINLSLFCASSRTVTYVYFFVVYPSLYSVSVLPLAAAAKSLQSCLTLCDPIDSSPPGSPVPGILQARTLEWVSISFSNAWKWNVKVKSLSHARLLVTPRTAANQAPLSMGFSRQEYWSGVPLPSPLPLAKPALIISRACCDVLVMCSCFHVGNLHPTLLC